MQKKFSEWVAETHPEFEQTNEALADLFKSPVDRRLDRVTSRDAMSRAANPAVKRAANNVEDIAADFIQRVKDAVKEARASSEMIQLAAERAARTVMSPRMAARTFLAAAFQNSNMAVGSVAKNLLSMTQAGSSLRTDDPTIAGSRMIGRAAQGSEISEKDRVKIQTMLADFTNYLTRSVSSGPAASPLA